MSFNKLPGFDPQGRVPDAEVTRVLKRVLRAALSTTKFKVSTSYSQVDIAWPNGPAQETVETALLEAGAKDKSNGAARWLCVYERVLRFSNYDPVERAAEAQKWAHIKQEPEARQQRENEALTEAQQARDALLAAPDMTLSAQLVDASAAPAAFEQLRQRAERDVATDTAQQRRPTWAPPLVIEGELHDACVGLGLLKPDAAPIMRLKATFADPKKAGSVLREQRSRHTLAGVQCRGFRLHVGAERGAILFEAQCTEAGRWRFGPQLYTHNYCSPRRHDWEALTRNRARSLDAAEQAEIQRKIAAIDAEDLAQAQTYYAQQQLRRLAVELAGQRVLEFAGAPGAQMQRASRLCGRCFNCWKELTDPISLELGIGPDCLAVKVGYIRRAARAGAALENIAFWCGMPLDFVVATLGPTHQFCIRDAPS